MNKHIHVVSFSSGLSSALTAIRVLERYGAENTKLVFMDTTIEDQDNYRFMKEFEQSLNTNTTLKILFISVMVYLLTRWL